MKIFAEALRPAKTKSRFGNSQLPVTEATHMPGAICGACGRRDALGHQYSDKIVGTDDRSDKNVGI
jgi:hypothetical protein